MSRLQTFIEQQRKDKPILLMTHVVYGYPTIDESLALMRDLLSEGVELLEVQFPFTDPSADGPSILHACHQALQQRPTLARCLADIAAIGREFPASRILLMSYLNPLYRYGLARLPRDAANAGIAGFIVPDLPLELADDFRHSCVAAQIEPIWMLTPETPPARMQQICAAASGMLYCVSRRGVTGADKATSPQNRNQHEDQPLEDYLAAIRTTTALPLAVGFGIRTGTQVQALHGLADIAVVGSGLLDAFNRGGRTAALEQVRSVRG
ncbi:tryptophan synthase subunit alpha [Marinobacterium sedimentorum]|uniref:tryptophan synthase subunit alpha n=1 Tax=Marinobacterium sedimentorum TaxID=2927804 RepID=UPI0020C69E4C|nr:tryptophan synthase subunit alpha [Marinobacterium sedimentorum]MCP8687271.1 tryptophan synthase subunit alpha [Marinobacterium sedimentorum]